jgi:chromate reductase
MRRSISRRPFLAVEIVAVLRAVAVLRRPRDRLDDLRALAVEERHQLVAQAPVAGDGDVVLRALGQDRRLDVVVFLVLAVDLAGESLVHDVALQAIPGWTMILPSHPFPSRKEFQYGHHLAASPSSSAACARIRSTARWRRRSSRRRRRRFRSRSSRSARLPLYNQDDDAAPPAASVAFKKAIEAADAVLFVTPEYNRSVPGVLKNAIDVGSRPTARARGRASPRPSSRSRPARSGGFGSNHHLRQSLVFLDMPVLQQPEAYIGGAGDLFDDAGAVKKPETKQFLDKFLAAFAAWIARTGGGADGVMPTLPTWPRAFRKRKPSSRKRA